MNNERFEFLKYVEKYVENDPEVAPLVSDYVYKGVFKNLQETRERATDMELALSVLAEKRYKGRDEFLKQRLEKWKGKTSLCWKWLEGKL